MSDTMYDTSLESTGGSSAKMMKKQIPQADSNRSGGVLIGSFRDVVLILIIAIALGVLIVVAYGLQARTITEFFSIAATGLLIGGASLGGGSLIGFLFSLPRMSQERGKSSETKVSTQPESELEGLPYYERNNNLIDISDWLTKILVGAGLAQLSSIAGGLRGLGGALAPALGSFPSSNVFAVGILIYFAVCGFFLVYLWNTLILPPLLRESDIQTRLRRAKSEGKDEKEKELEKTFRQAVELPKGKRVLWVDDKPENNLVATNMLVQTLGVQVETSKTTNEALEKVAQDHFDLVISDMSRPEHPQAGYELLRQMKARGITTPFIIYSSSGRPEHDIEARDRGALGSTNSPLKLLQLATVALKSLTG